MQGHINTRETRSRGDFNPEDGVVSIQLHGVQLLDHTNVSIIDSIIKTYNSVSRCSFKHFQGIGLNNLLKSHKTPNKRRFMSNFKNVPMVNGKPVEYECPPGMSDETWRKLREDAYKAKSLKAWGNANAFWQIDKDLGNPIRGTEKLVGEWVKSNGYELDSILLHNAVLSGFKSYKSFERQKSKFKTAKEHPSFGEQVERSKRKITKEEFQLTRNSSFTVIGREKVGNPKFKFNLDDCTFDFIYKRKKIGFSFTSHRFSKKGLKRLSDLLSLMEQGKIATTVTITKVAQGKFSVSLSYSPTKLNELRKDCKCSKPRSNIVTGIWFSDDIIHHQVENCETHEILHSKTYKVSELSGESKVRKQMEMLRYKGKYDTLGQIRKNLNNKKLSCIRDLLNEMFKVSNAYGSEAVVVETPSSKTKRNFNNGFVVLDKSRIGGNPTPRFMNASGFVNLVKSQCAKNGMTLKKVNGTFIELNAVLTSRTMAEAIRKATSEMVARASEGQGIFLTKSVEQVIKSNPSMLDWVGHLLHNKRNRQARCEVRKAFTSRAVEKAARLVDNRYKRKDTEIL